MGRGSSKLGGNSNGRITDQDWMSWAEDPEPFQAIINGESIPRISQADGHEYTAEEISRFRQIAPEIQRMAEEGEVDENTLFRGESFNSLLEARRKYKVGKTITNDKMTSYTTNSNIATDYAGGNTDFMDKGAVKVVITNTNVNRNMRGSVGVKTDPFGIGGSAEVITPKGMKSKVMDTYYDSSSSTLYVRMENKAAPKRRK